MTSQAETIKAGEKLPKALAKDIRSFLHEDHYQVVSKSFKGIPASTTLRALLYSGAKVSENNLEAVKTCARLAIQNSQSALEARQHIIDSLGEKESIALYNLNERMSA